MNVSLTKKAEKQLRAAGWFPGRHVPLSVSSPQINELPAAVGLLCEYGDLSLRPDKQSAFVFGPDFESGPETDLPRRIVSGDDIRLAISTWIIVSQRIGSCVCNVAWEQGQDEHAIAVDQEGRVYCATWQLLPNSPTAEVAVMKVADSMIAYLNHWLDPCGQTRANLHAIYPRWSEETTISL